MKRKKFVIQNRNHFKIKNIVSEKFVMASGLEKTAKFCYTFAV